MKLGYFTNSKISPTETFIYDLVYGLNNQTDIDLTFVSGALESSKLDLNIKNISTGFAEKGLDTAFRASKIGQIVGGKGQDYKMYFRQKNSFKSLLKANLPNFDIAFIDYATTGVLVYRYLVKENIPFVVNVNGFDASSMLEDKAYLRELNVLFKTSHTFIAPSKHLKRRLVLAGCNPDKIIVLPYGVDVESIKPISWDLKKLNEPSVVFLGRLTPKKNPIALLYAFNIVKKTIPNCQFTIIGDGELKKEVEETLDKLKLRKCVKMPGFLPRSKSFQILNKHWIYAQHSVTANSGDQEGFPVSLAEAAAHELPIVSTIHSGITENIIDGKTGFLVQEHDYEAMAKKIIYLIQHPEIAEQMGKSGRERIKQLCEPEKRVRKIKALLISASK